MQINGIPISTDYRVHVNGVSAPVYIMPTRYGMPYLNGQPMSFYGGEPWHQPMYFVCADIPGPVPVSVELGFLTDGEIRTVTAHPLSRGIAVNREGTRVSFTVDQPGTVTLVVNGDHRTRPLHLFFSPPVEAAPEDAIVFGPGFHDLGYDKPITLTDGQTLYLASGAWVEGLIRANGARNIRIMGRGVLAQRRVGSEHYSGCASAPAGIVLSDCQDVSISGIVETRGIGGWCSMLSNCDRVMVRDYHVLASVVWSADGFNPCNSRDVTLERCFIRSGDDAIAIKGNTGGNVLTLPHIPPSTQPPVENILIRNCVFWSDHNEVIVIGCETRARYIRNIRISDCDVIFHYAHEGLGVFGIIPLHGTEISDIVYENIRVEHCEEQVFCFRFLDNIWGIPGDQSFPGGISNVTIRNVTVLYQKDGPRSEFTGYGPDKRIETVRIEGLRYGDKPVTDAAGMGLRKNEHVAEVSYQ
ncbi:MAG: hypothetical protein FJ222_07105 [Lentisphaerae bacterium]|nr:hypothetical protein [Lentisphaerota bacterium]